MKKSKEASFIVLLFCMGIHACGSPVEVPPDASVGLLKLTPPSTNAWWRADDSMRAANEKAVTQWMPPECAVNLMEWGLLHEPYRMLTRTEEYYTQKAPQILEALYRGGDDPRITNILHKALLAPTNCYREATFRAYVMASPVPMAVLVRTVAEKIPEAERLRWYALAREKAYRPTLAERLNPFSSEDPSRESLRMAHFLCMAKAAETNAACLKSIGDPVAPDRREPRLEAYLEPYRYPQQLPILAGWRARELNRYTLPKIGERPDEAAPYLNLIPRTTNAWWLADDSMRAANEAFGNARLGGSDEVIKTMGWALLEKRSPLTALPPGLSNGIHRERALQVLESLGRSGDDPRITNILHRALLTPTNYYREATFHAYVMASPVPMVVLAQSVAEKTPEAERLQWYALAREKAYFPTLAERLNPLSTARPSRESLRMAHFLCMAKAAETNAACLAAIGDPVDPKREEAEP
jgi:hypothetical protein